VEKIYHIIKLTKTLFLFLRATRSKYPKKIMCTFHLYTNFIFDSTLDTDFCLLLNINFKNTVSPPLPLTVLSLLFKKNIYQVSTGKQGRNFMYVLPD